MASYGRPADVFTLTIAAGQPYTKWVSVHGRRALALGCPAALTGATLTVEAAEDQLGTNAKVVNGLSITPVASNIIPLTTDALYRGLQALGWIRFKSASNEASDRELELHCGGY